MSATEGVVVKGEMAPRYDEVLTDDALAFLAGLHRAFESRRSELLAARVTRQKAFDDVAVCVRGVVRQKVGDLFPRRRKAGEVEGYAPQEAAFVGWAGGLEPRLSELRPDERVDRRTFL